MKIAITADLHLNQNNEHPERTNALIEILTEMKNQKITHLIIAGDCFDNDKANVVDFEKIIRNFDHDFITYLLPGNHDKSLKQRYFTSNRIRVFEKTEINTIGEMKFLLVPYNETTSMGEEIGKFINDLSETRWVLVGHANLAAYDIADIEYEQGMYMPLSKRDLNIFKPSLCVLGHIHKPFKENQVIYTGSPCGLDITETGRRRFLILDTKNLEVISQTIHTDVIYLNEECLVYPCESEYKMIQEEIKEMLCEYEKTEMSNINLRLRLSGFSIDKSELSEKLQTYISQNLGIKTLDLNLDHVQPVNSNYILQQIAEKTNDYITNSDMGEFESEKKAVVKQAMKVIFGE